MKLLLLICASVLLLAPSNARGQVVQLPTYQFFSVGTTAAVPDRGHALLGGVQSRKRSASSFGVPGAGRLPVAGRLFGSRGLASTTGGASSSASVTIHDPAAHDRRLGLAPASPDDENVFSLNRHVADAAAEARAASSVSAIHSRHEAADRKREQDWQRRMLQGQAAEAAGRFGAARCSYLAVARHANGHLRQKALTRLAALSEVEKALRPK